MALVLDKATGSRVPGPPLPALPEHIVQALNSCPEESSEDDDQYHTIVDAWLAAGNDINATDQHGRALLHLVVCGMIGDYHSDVDRARRLLERNVDPNHSTGGYCAMHYAARGFGFATPAMVSLLVAAGADLETRIDSDSLTFVAADSTPLGVCLFVYDDCDNDHRRSNTLDIARILLRAGASLDRVEGDLSAEDVLARTERKYLDRVEGDSYFSAEDYLAARTDLEHLSLFWEDGKYFSALKTLVHGTRSRRTIAAIARLRSYATRGRASAQVLILDHCALTTVRIYNSLFGLPDELFKKIVLAL